MVLGVLLGMRHALEPDHLAAVSTLAVDEGSPRRAAWLGAFWGLGHTAALLVVGVVLAALHRRLAPRIADSFELGVAVMLIALGCRAIVLAGRVGGTRRTHTHGGRTHTHGGADAHVHLGGTAFAMRSLVVGLVHGLAGSGALTTLVLASMPSTSARMAYIALFGIGSVVGMTLLTGVMGWPLARLGRDGRVARAVGLAAGSFSTLLGAVGVGRSSARSFAEPSAPAVPHDAALPDHHVAGADAGCASRTIHACVAGGRADPRRCAIELRLVSAQRRGSRVWGASLADGCELHSCIVKRRVVPLIATCRGDNGQYEDD
jgi:hypothetical protein